MPALDDRNRNDFFALLCCPDCADRPRLAFDPKCVELRCPCPVGRKWPIVDGIPDLRPILFRDQDAVEPPASAPDTCPESDPPRCN